MSQRFILRGALVLLATAFVGVAELAAQSAPADTLSALMLRIYHGRTGRSSIMALDAGNGAVVPASTSYRAVRPAGSEVCLQIDNAHPVMYAYTLSTKVDTVKPSLPDVSALVTILKAALPEGVAAKGNGVPLRSQDGDEWHVVYADGLRPLHNEITQAQEFVVASDVPETKTQIDAATEDLRTGFRYAQWEIAHLPNGPLHFGSKKLADELDKLYETATKSATDAAKRRDATLPLADARRLNEIDQQLLESLHGFAASLLAVRNALRSGYGASVSPTVRTCSTVGQNVTHIVLTVGRKDTINAVARDTGAIVRLYLIPRYSRPTIELVPTAFGAFAGDIPAFAVVNDTIRETRSDMSRLRAGGVLLANLSNDYMPDGSVSLGAGLVFGIGGDKKSLSDLGGAVMVSYRDLFRIGIGTGVSALPDGLKDGLQKGQALPKNVASLDNVVSTRMRRSTFLLFTISGLSLPLAK